MAETQQSRLATQVFILGRGEVPVGSGFICSQGHVMTCAHVVADALGGGVEMAAAPIAPDGRVKVRFAAPLAAGATAEVVAEAEVVADAWRPRDDSPCSDIAVLKVVEGEPWPPSAAAVTAVRDDPRPDERFIGLGVSKESPRGVIIQGAVAGLLPGDRLSIRPASIDQKVVPGCSGAAIFTYERGGMAGMVVEMQQTETGLAIPARLLQTVWPIADYDERSPIVKGTAGGPLPVKWHLAERLHTFDREDQELWFEEAVQDVWKQARLPIICVIGGLEADLPDKCQDRCLQISLGQSLGRALPIDRLTPLHLPWPPDSAFKVDQALAALKRGFRNTLAAEDLSAEAIRAARADAGRAFFFFSSMRAENYSRRHGQLLRAWSEFLQSTSGGAVDDDEPVLHFLHLILPGREFRSTRADPDEPLRKAYRKIVGGLASDVVRPLPPLTGFGDSMVDNWLARICQDLALPIELSRELKMSAENMFVPLRHARLRDLRNWINTLN
jgi:hypothetical protein